MTAREIPVFWCEPTDTLEVSIRRYADDAKGPCPAMPGKYSYHDASVVIGEAPAVFDERGYVRQLPELPHADPRWPRACGCGHVFADDDRWQTNGELLYRGAPDGKRYTLRHLPAGAMWDADWLRDATWATGPDGIALMVRTPGGDWSVDGEASNCTRPQHVPVPDTPGCQRFERTHYCWVRHGDPRDPQGARSGQPLHVDKAGDTCAAGAGSIVSGSYHGFLHQGRLVQC